MELGGQLHAPTALSLEEEPSVPIGQEAGWPQGQYTVRVCVRACVAVFSE
jgi:hypothetical protein